MSAIVGAPVVAVEPCGWGFENRTAVATLSDGRRLVVQRIAGRAVARHKIRLARALPERLAAAGLRAPRLLAASADADPPYAVREYLPGVPGASLMSAAEGAIQIARAMGALLPRLASVPTDGAPLWSIWADPHRLAGLAHKQIARCRALLDAPAIQALETTVAEAPALLTGRPACFAHGDFCPVNVLVERSNVQTFERSNVQVVGLLDLEFARIADPLFDAAWWGWVVRYHHPARWAAAWPQLLAAAGIAPDDATLARVRVLQRLRCLEIVDYYARTRTTGEAAMWVDRLQATLAWQ